MAISNDVLSSTLRILLDEEVDQLYQATPLLDKMRERGGVVTYDGGQKLNVPMILEEHFTDEFVVYKKTKEPYMQSVYKCKYPDLYPAIVHEDGTSRVQTVGKNDHPGVRALLEKWHFLTGCPMLLNTSLNIKGEPMVNNRADADRFEKRYGVKVCS